MRHAIVLASLLALSGCGVMRPLPDARLPGAPQSLAAAPQLASFLHADSWRPVLAPEFEKDYFARLQAFLGAEKAAGHAYFPGDELVFNAFNTTPFDQVNVVIIGQDPYPTPGVAMGLSFSVADGVKVPASLGNIYQELQTDLGIAPAKTGNLTKWARQGVLLLNATLTVRAGAPNSHAGKGWESFTDTAISAINARRSGVVFLLWGKFAQAKTKMIDPKKHHVLTAGHPSPLSARTGFFGCKHFSKTNALLEQEGRPPIDWSLD
jgi:uracil-DNA glycosylase